MATKSSSILITGGTLGLGYCAALNVAKACPDAHIIIASRTNTDDAAARLQKATSHTSISFMPLDLSESSKVRTFVAAWESKNLPPIRALFLNAGLQFPGPTTLTEDGIEKTFAVNHVGHALLFHLLTPHLAEDARIILTASGVHDPAQKTGLPDATYTTAAALAKPDPPPKDGRLHYCNSKLANVLWAYALRRRIEGSARKWTVAAFDPGLMPGTGLAREYPAVLRFLWLHVLPQFVWIVRLVSGANIHTQADSGASLAWVGVVAGAAEVDGKYFEGRKIIRSSDVSYDVEKQDNLWKWTIERVFSSTDEAARFDHI